MCFNLALISFSIHFSSLRLNTCKTLFLAFIEAKSLDIGEHKKSAIQDADHFGNTVRNSKLSREEDMARREETNHVSSLDPKDDNRLPPSSATPALIPILKNSQRRPQRQDSAKANRETQSNQTVVFQDETDIFETDKEEEKLPHRKSSEVLDATQPAKKISTKDRIREMLDVTAYTPSENKKGGVSLSLVEPGPVAPRSLLPTSLQDLKPICSPKRDPALRAIQYSTSKTPSNLSPLDDFVLLRTGRKRSTPIFPQRSSKVFAPPGM